MNENDTKVFGCLYIMGIITIIIAMFIPSFIAPIECNQFQKHTGLKTDYYWANGCIVTTKNGNKVELNQLRGF